MIILGVFLFYCSLSLFAIILSYLSQFRSTMPISGGPYPISIQSFVIMKKDKMKFKFDYLSLFYCFLFLFAINLCSFFF